MLTKSKFMNGLQCPRLLWHADRKLLPEISLSDKHKFAQGHDFETYVWQLFPKGVNLSGLEFKDNVEKTAGLISKKKTIFEAGIQVGDFFVRADILEYKKGWNLIEIKSSTEVKPEHIPDLAFQKYVFEKAGIKINKCFVYFLNKEYVKKGKINPKKLILFEDVTEKVELVQDLDQNSRLAFDIMQRKESPPITISRNCNSPHECPLKEKCWGTLPKHNVLELTNWRTYWKLYEDGITEIKDIPAGTKLCDKDEILRDATIKNQVYVSKEHIKHFLDGLHYPLFHFDFETFDTAVPIFDKSRPYQKVPFQFSLHIQQKDGTVEHHEFLAKGGEDPRLELLEAMKKVFNKTSGDVIVFNQSFEIGRLQELAEDFPKHKKWIQNVLDRIVDLLVPFRSFHYYNPEQKGSASIKKVLPAVTGKSYKELEINNGGDASMLYFYSHIRPEMTNKEEIRENLIKYCGLDTEGMVLILQELKKLVR